MVPYFAKSLIQGGMAAPAIAFYRFILTAIVLFPFLSIGKDKRSTTLWGIFAGAAMGIGWIGYVEALKTAPISTVGVLYMTYPMFTVILAWFWFGDRPSLKSIIAASLIFITAIIAMSPATVEAHHLLALLVSLTAPLSFGISINILTNKLIGISPLARMACVSMGSVIGLLPLILPLGPEKILPTSVVAWWSIGGIAIITAMLPQLLYVVNAPYIGSAKAAMVGSIELPTMFVVGWFAFGEVISPVQLIAGAIVLIAIVITPPRRALSVVSKMATPNQ